MVHVAQSSRACIAHQLKGMHCPPQVRPEELPGYRMRHKLCFWLGLDGLWTLGTHLTNPYDGEGTSAHNAWLHGDI